MVKLDRWTDNRQERKASRGARIYFQPAREAQGQEWLLHVSSIPPPVWQICIPRLL